MKTIAIIGYGNRGSGYAGWVKLLNSRRAKIVAVCDKQEKRLKNAQKQHSLPDERCYLSDDEFFAAGKLADAIFICTLDRDHYRHAVRAIELGYQIMLEKPVSTDPNEILDLERRAKEKGVNIVVCHVMRYMPFYLKLREIVKSGKYGRILGINHTENVGYFHFSHSYVRGNWHREDETAPMLLAKSCHDFDYIDWLMQGGCKSLSSLGDLTIFNSSNAPEGAAKRCLDCPAEIKKKCPYDAEYLYITAPLHKATFVRFMGSTITGKPGCTRADKYEALKNGPYGRCVYASDNDVCDHQVTLLDYGQGRFATINTTAFAKRCFRRIIIHLENADIIADDGRGTIVISDFRGGVKRKKIGFVHIGHLAGDRGIVNSFLNLLEEKPEAETEVTFIGTTYISHNLVSLAEISRKQGGKRLEV